MSEKMSMGQVMDNQEFVKKFTSVKELQPPFIVKNQDSIKLFDEWKQVNDSWFNNVANVNANNSIMQYSYFQLERLSYQECASLYSDPIINKAITTLVNEMINQWGKVVLKDNNDDKNNKKQQKIIDQIEDLMDKFNFKTTLRDASIKALTFGGCFIYIDTTDKEIDKPLYFNHKTLSVKDKIKGFRIIEPWLIAPLKVNTSNPILEDYMKPESWAASMTGSIHGSRIIPITFYPSTDMLKPMYNYLGISMTQFMKDHVKCAETIRQSLADMFLRFRLIAIKTNLAKVDPQEAVDRVKVINQQANNLGGLILAEDEDLVETATSLSGLEGIQAQAFENMVISSRLPAVKLLGISPSGFNSTGDFDLQNYYDEVMGYQNVVLKPIIEKIIELFKLSLSENEYIYNFEFNPLEKMTLEKEAELTDKKIQGYLNLLSSGILTEEQVFDQLKIEGLIDSSFKFDDDLLDDEGDEDGENKDEKENPKEA